MWSTNFQYVYPTSRAWTVSSSTPPALSLACRRQAPTGNHIWQSLSVHQPRSTKVDIIEQYIQTDAATSEVADAGARTALTAILPGPSHSPTYPAAQPQFAGDNSVSSYYPHADHLCSAISHSYTPISSNCCSAADLTATSQPALNRKDHMLQTTALAGSEPHTTLILPSSSQHCPPIASQTAPRGSAAADPDLCIDSTSTSTSTSESEPECATAPEPSWSPPDWLQRTTLLLGHEGVTALRDCRVVVVGLGGVGSYVAEFLVRAGVGSLAVVDGDVVDISNKNRQLLALDSTVGQPKAHVMSQRLLDINPHLNLVVRQEFLTPDDGPDLLLDELAEELARGELRKVQTDTSAVAAIAGSSGEEGSSWEAVAAGRHGVAEASGHSEVGNMTSRTVATHAQVGPGSGSLGVPELHWVIDCIDCLAPKLALVVAAARRGARVVSSMGAGGRMDPLAVHVADISETYGDPFAAACRRGLRRQYGIKSGITVVFSTELCRRSSLALTTATQFKRSYYGTISFLPALFGLLISAHVINAHVGGPMMASEERLREDLRRQREVAVGSGKGWGGAATPGKVAGRRNRTDRSTGMVSEQASQEAPLSSVARRRRLRLKP